MIRIALFSYLRDLSERMIQAKANETLNFVESLRAMQSIKLFNHGEREISRVLQDLKITRISIAHRSELAEAADVMLRFEGPDWETSIPAQSRAIVPGAASEVRRNLASTPAG